MPMHLPQRQANLETLITAFDKAKAACFFSLAALLLSSCSMPPKPPSVDESTKRPVNARGAVDLKACQGDLSRASILMTELSRAGGASTPKASLPGSTWVSAADAISDEAAGNLVAVVPFGVGSAAWSVEPADAAALVRRAQGAALIMIRGRTDATGDSMQETALARRRAEVAAKFFQQAGVPKDKLRLTWQGAGDPVAGGRGVDRVERSQSRRVEIEFYAAAPVLVSLRGTSTNSKVKGTTAASL